MTGGSAVPRAALVLLCRGVPVRLPRLALPGG